MTRPNERRLDTLESEVSGAIVATSISVTGDAESTSVTLTDKAVWKIAEIALTATELSGSEVNTSFTFPASGAIFLDAWLNVTDAEAASTIDVGTQGTSNDPNGILDGVSVATLGYVGAAGTVGLRNRFIAGSDPVSVTASGDLNSCTATLYISYLELPSLS